MSSSATVRLAELEGKDVIPLHKLTVAPEQEDFVAPNAVTIAQGRFERNSSIYTIWAGETRVGLVALIDMRNNPDRDTGDHPEALYVWRLMIGAEFQRQGYGKAAMDAVITLAQTNGHPLVQIQAVHTNSVAIAFYEGLGFRKTGNRFEGEDQLELWL